MTTQALAMIENLIYELRGVKIILDADLARIYNVETKSLNRAIRRNTKRFPRDFMFQLTGEEADLLRCQIGTSNSKSLHLISGKRGGRRYLPYAFTEHGAIMAANVLNNPRAVQMSVFVVRAFLKMRAALTDTRMLAPKLAALEKELKDRLNVHEAAIVTILQRVMDLIDPSSLPEPPKRKMGFGVEEREAVYGRNSASGAPGAESSANGRKGKNGKSGIHR